MALLLFNALTTLTTNCRGLAVTGGCVVTSMAEAIVISTGQFVKGTVRESGDFLQLMGKCERIR